jgi:hypothetical protein
MVYHITKIVNNSSKTIVLTNPVAQRDRHVVTKNSWTIPPHPPKIEIIKDNTVSYPTALKKALNIYTSKNNWCFWDNGAAGLLGIGDNGDPLKFPTPPNVTRVVLKISEDGVPSFRPESDDQCFLKFKIEEQQRMSWCWAATTTSIANFYLGENTKDPWKQCELANHFFNQTTCCAASNCDKAWKPWDALVYTRNDREIIGGPTTFKRIMESINDGQPISIALSAWPVGHGVVITGYNNFNPDRPTVEIRDPDGSNRAVCDFNTFPKSYSIRYGWAQTYLTEPAPA